MLNHSIGEWSNKRDNENNKPSPNELATANSMTKGKSILKVRGFTPGPVINLPGDFVTDDDAQNSRETTNDVIITKNPRNPEIMNLDASK